MAEKNVIFLTYFKYMNIIVFKFKNWGKLIDFCGSDSILKTLSSIVDFVTFHTINKQTVVIVEMSHIFAYKIISLKI